MKKHALVIFTAILFPVLLYSVPDKKITIAKLSVKSMPFNERRDPVADSPYNAFDGDIRTAALYADFTIEFKEPAAMNEIKIINGSAGDKSLFKQNSRLRDIEITLYTDDISPEKKVPDKKVVKKKTKPAKKIPKIPGKKETKKNPDKPDKKEPKSENKENTKAKDLINISSDSFYDANAFIFAAVQEGDITKDNKASSPDTDKKNTGTSGKEKSPEQDNNNNKITKTKPGDKIKKVVNQKQPGSEKKAKKVNDKKTELKKLDEKDKTGKLKTKTDIRDEVKPVPRKETDAEKKEQKKAESTGQKKDDSEKVKTGNKKTDSSEKKKDNTGKTPDSESVKKEMKKPGDKKISKSVTKPLKKKTGKKPIKQVPLKSTAGIFKPQNDRDGRVFIYHTLKDSMGPQSIKLKKSYNVSKILFRTRDNEFYYSKVKDRACIAEIGFYNKGKKIPIDGLDEMKKKYADKYNSALFNSINGAIFLLYNQNDIIMRVIFHRDGKIGFIDRYKCRNKNDKDCTSLLFPDRWRIRDGKLYMRFQEIWMLWKFELECPYDFINETQPGFEIPGYLKIYNKKGNDFTEDYLHLFRNSENFISE
jgi:hypothetical protein